MPDSYSSSKDEIRIKSVRKMKTELKNIASHTGETISGMLRPKIREFIDSFPDNYREEYLDD